VPSNAPDGICPRCLVAVALSQANGRTSKAAADRSALDPRPSTVPGPGERPIIPYFGDYELLGEIARGGMGIVYRARQLSLNRIVAVKVLLFGKFSSDQFVQRFRAEAEAAAALQHPNIVAIHEIGEHEGQQYFSMDYIEGTNLAGLVRDKPLAATPAAVYLQTVAEAIHYAHQRGVLHRDLKPSNVLIDSDGEPHITDFGLAKRLSNSELGTRNAELTVTGQLLGSPNYMPPEQADCTRGEVTVASDVYSLGAILYHLLTGRPPFVAETLEDALRQLLNTEPVSPRLLNGRVPRDLETICLKCLNKEPVRRYGSAQALAEDLAHWRAGEPIVARPVNSAEKFWRWCKRKPVVTALGASVLLLLASVAVVSTLAAFRIERSRRDATKAAHDAMQAQRETQERLWDSYLAQARANRFSGRVGRRFDSLDAIAKAAAIRSTPELRNEAIACMALSDLKLIKRLPRPSGARTFALNEEMTQYAVLRTSGEISIHEVRDDRELLRLPAIGEQGRCLYGFSHNGKLLAVGYAGRIVRVWDLERQEVKTLSRAVQADHAVDFAPNDDDVAMVNPELGVVIHKLTAGTERVIGASIKARFVIYDRAGTRLALGGANDSRVLVVDAESGRTLATLPHEETIRGLAWHPNGRMLATINHERSGRMVHVWDPDTGANLRSLSGHLGDIDSVLFSRSGEFLFTSGWDGTRVWNSETGERVLTLATSGGTLRMSADDKRLARWIYVTADVDVYEFASGAEARKLYSKEPALGPKAAAFSPDGTLLASAVDGMLTFFSVSSGKSLAAETVGIVHSLHFDRTTNLWVSGEQGLSRRKVVWNQDAARLEVTLPQPVGLANATDNAAISADGSTLAVIHGDHAHVFDTATDRQMSRTPALGDVRWVSLNPDGRWLATGIWRGEAIKIWNSRTGNLYTNLAQHSGYAVFSPDGSTLITGVENGLSLWDTRSWQPRWKKTYADSSVHAFAPDGSFLAVREAKSYVHLIAAGSGELLAVLEAPGSDHVQDLVFSPDGTHLAQVQRSVRELIVWDLVLLRKQLAAMKLDWKL
jgi:eukaryotic-like serine/threonine-protein kinase